MYNFEILKKYNKNTGRWSGVIKVVNNDEELPNRVFEITGIYREEYSIYEIDYKILDKKLEFALQKAKNYIDQLREAKKVCDDLGESKTIVTY